MAAIFAIGNPVAFDASAELRDTRGFISMITIRPFAGLMANCTLEPPVSTPISRRQRERAVAHHLILAVGQGLRGRDGDGIAGVHAHRVEVLDRADDDAVVRQVAHHLQLEFLPAERALFDQHFVNRGEVEAALQNFVQLFACCTRCRRRCRPCVKLGRRMHRIADALGELETRLRRC